MVKKRKNPILAVLVIGIIIGVSYLLVMGNQPTHVNVGAVEYNQKTIRGSLTTDQPQQVQQQPVTQSLVNQQNTNQQPQQQNTQLFQNDTSQLVVRKLGTYIEISGKVQMINPVGNANIPPPYDYVMQIKCTSEWCNSNNLPTPKGITDFSGSVYYKLNLTTGLVQPADYDADITFFAKDGSNVEGEVHFPFRVIN